MRAQVERQDAALQKKQKNESKIQLQRPPEREGYGDVVLLSMLTW